MLQRPSRQYQGSGVQVGTAPRRGFPLIFCATRLRPCIPCMMQGRCHRAILLLLPILNFSSHSGSPESRHRLVHGVQCVNGSLIWPRTVWNLLAIFQHSDTARRLPADKQQFPWHRQQVAHSNSVLTRAQCRSQRSAVVATHWGVCKAQEPGSTSTCSIRCAKTSGSPTTQVPACSY